MSGASCRLSGGSVPGAGGDKCCEVSGAEMTGAVKCRALNCEVSSASTANVAVRC